MSKEKIELMVDGGKAIPNASISQVLGPLRVDISNVIKRINEKTMDFNGMKIPVKVIIDTKTKDVEIEIGTPPISELIKKEISSEKGSGEPNKNKIGNLAVEQIVKLAKMKYNGMHVNNLRAAVKSVIGSCNSMGVLIEGKNAVEINKDIHAEMYDDIIKHERTDVSAEKRIVLDKQLKDIQDKIKKELEKAAKEATAKEAVEAKKEKVIAQETETSPPTKEGSVKERAKEAAPTSKASEKKEEKKK